MKRSLRPNQRGWGLLLALALLLMTGGEDAWAQSRGERDTKGRTRSSGTERVERKKSEPVKKRTETRSTGTRRTETRSSGTRRTETRQPATGTRRNTGTVNREVQRQETPQTSGTREGRRTPQTSGTREGRRTPQTSGTREGSRTPQTSGTREGSRTPQTSGTRDRQRGNPPDDGARTDRRRQQTQDGRRRSTTQDGRIVIPSERPTRQQGNGRYKNQRRDYRYYQPPKQYHRTRYHRRNANHLRYVGPRFQVHVHWPWAYRYSHRWQPRYRYRQVVHVEVGWGQRRRQTAIDVRTYYRHQVRRATQEYAEIDIQIERIELYADGRFLGTVDQIPHNLSDIRATVYRNGRLDFDREVFVVGDPVAGFELISTRYYDDHVLNAYHRGDGYRVGRLDLRRGRVTHASRSYLFRPYDRDSYAPISLLPENEDWLWDYGYSAAGGYDDDYFYGDDAYENDNWDDARYDDYRERYSVQRAPGTASTRAPLRYDGDASYRTGQGAEVRLKREVELQRID